MVIQVVLTLTLQKLVEIHANMKNPLYVAIVHKKVQC